MSITEGDTNAEEPLGLQKRKREANEEDIEINLDAPEPPSKKALRKAKKVKTSDSGKSVKNNDVKNEEATEDALSSHGKRSEFGIWIGNLSFTTTKQDLLNFMISDTEHVIPQENITRIHLPAGPVKFGKPQNKGFAYIDFSDSTSLQSALELSEKLLAGRRVLIKNATSFEGRPDSKNKETPSNPPSRRIFVGNLDFQTTVEDLEKHFGVCGPMQSTHMATFEDSGKCKGYAWIEFEQLSAAQAAMRGWVEGVVGTDNEAVKRSKQRTWLNKIGGRKLRMEFAEDKTTRYNKRYGKNALQNKPNADAPAIEEVEEERKDDNGERRSKFVSRDDRSARPRQPERQNIQTPRQGGGYAQETVRKMKGAIVEAQGKRTTFE